MPRYRSRVRASYPAPNFKDREASASLLFGRECQHMLAPSQPQDPGAIAKRLCNGLQIRLVRFDSGSRLQIFLSDRAPDAEPFVFPGRPHNRAPARVAKSVDAADLKSATSHRVYGFESRPGHHGDAVAFAPPPSPSPKPFCFKQFVAPATRVGAATPQNRTTVLFFRSRGRTSEVRRLEWID